MGPPTKGMFCCEPLLAHLQKAPWGYYPRQGSIGEIRYLWSQQKEKPQGAFSLFLKIALKKELNNISEKTMGERASNPSRIPITMSSVCPRIYKQNTYCEWCVVFFRLSNKQNRYDPIEVIMKWNPKPSKTETMIQAPKICFRTVQLPFS